MNETNRDPELAFNRAEDRKYRFDYLPLLENCRPSPAISMNQIGDLCTRAGFRIGQHVQHYHEICYIESGSGRISLNGRWHPVNHGDLIIIRCNDTHDMMTDDQNPMRLFYFEFFIKSDARAQSPYRDILSLLESTSPDRSISHRRFEIEPVFTGIFNEMARQDRFYGSYLETYSLQLLISVYRAFIAAERPGGANDADERSSLALDLSRYIEANVESLSDLNQLSAVFRYSYSHLASVFREEMGISLFQYYDQKRFEKAVSLLCEGNIRIGEIAERLQYQSVSAFSKAFNKRFGLSPSKYAASYWNMQEYTPLYDQGRKLVSGEDQPDMCIVGNVFYCAGSCVRAVENSNAARESADKPMFLCLGAPTDRDDDDLFD